MSLKFTTKHFTPFIRQIKGKWPHRPARSYLALFQPFLDELVHSFLQCLKGHGTNRQKHVVEITEVKICSLGKKNQLSSVLPISLRVNEVEDEYAESFHTECILSFRPQFLDFNLAHLVSAGLEPNEVKWCQQQHVTDALSGEGRGGPFLPLCQQQQIQSISQSVGRSVGQSITTSFPGSLSGEAPRPPPPPPTPRERPWERGWVNQSVNRSTKQVGWQTWPGHVM